MDFLTQAISWIGDFISTCLMAVALPFISLLPNAADSPSLPNLPMSYMTMNISSFVKWDWLVWALGIFIAVAIVCIFVTFIRFVISVIHDVADSLPIIG